MRHQGTRSLIGALAALLAAVSVAAQGPCGFLRDTPAAALNAKDWQLLRNAVRDAVEQDASAKPVEWKNPDNGHSGRVAATKAFESDEGRDCRKVLIESSAGGRSGTTKYDLCLYDDGIWREIDSGVPFTDPVR
jgi:surface antigen